MNTIIQNILVFSTLALAITFLIRKFIWKKSTSKKACSDDKNCACH